MTFFKKYATWWLFLVDVLLLLLTLLLSMDTLKQQIQQIYGNVNQSQLDSFVNMAVILGIVSGIIMVIIGAFISVYLIKWISGVSDVYDDETTWYRMRALLFQLVYGISALGFIIQMPVITSKVAVVIASNGISVLAAIGMAYGVYYILTHYFNQISKKQIIIASVVIFALNGLWPLINLISQMIG